jgi:hypothetical protein
MCDAFFIGTRENKAKSDSGESLTKIFTDKLKWLCRGCQDPEQEPIAEQVQPVIEINTSGESSTEVLSLNFADRCLKLIVFVVSNFYFKADQYVLFLR